jgi:hypothetical protein
MPTLPLALNDSVLEEPADIEDSRAQSSNGDEWSDSDDEGPRKARNRVTKKIKVPRSEASGMTLQVQLDHILCPGTGGLRSPFEERASLQR